MGKPEILFNYEQQLHTLGDDVQHIACLHPLTMSFFFWQDVLFLTNYCNPVDSIDNINRGSGNTS